MEVTVRLLAAVKGLAPGERRVGLPEGATLADLLAALGLGPDAEVVALIDSAPAWPATSISPGALVELMPIVDGG